MGTVQQDYMAPLKSKYIFRCNDADHQLLQGFRPGISDDSGRPRHSIDHVVPVYLQSGVYFLDYGKSSAAAMILFLIVALLTVFQFKAEKKFVNY